MWEINCNRRVHFGCGSIRKCAPLAKELGLNKVLLIVYSADAVGLDALKSDLEENGIGYALYDGVKQEPDLAAIDNGADLCRSSGCDGVIAMGGGSVLDASKAIAMLAANGGHVEEYQMGAKSIDKPCVPMIMIPTTSGTGSEATRVSVVFNPNNGLKKSFYSPYMIGDIVILDPELTTGLPSAITAATGMDALSHAIESYVSLNANDATEMYSLKALELIRRSFVRTLQDGTDTLARGDMMLASFFAGCAISAGIGVAHIIAQPLGGMLHIPHGDACSIFLPFAMEANLEHSLKKYAKIAQTVGVADSNTDDRAAAQAGIAWVRKIQSTVNAPVSLEKWIVSAQFSMEQTVDIIAAATGHIKCNPRPVDQALLRSIIQQSMNKR